MACDRLAITRFPFAPFVTEQILGKGFADDLGPVGTAAAWLPALSGSSDTINTLQSLFVY